MNLESCLALLPHILAIALALTSLIIVISKAMRRGGKGVEGV